MALPTLLEHFKTFILSINTEHNIENTGSKLWRSKFLNSLNGFRNAANSSALEGRTCTNTHLMASTILLDCRDKSAFDGPQEEQHTLMNTKIITIPTSGKISNSLAMFQTNNGHEP